MRTLQTTFSALIVVVLGSTGIIQAQTNEKPDLTKKPTLYVVGYAHLDTEWRWEYPQVIDEYLRIRCDTTSACLRNIRTTPSISVVPIFIV
jgi:alpha-mannosidase